MNAQENMLGWLRATLKPEFDELAEKIDVQADIVGQLGASFHALASRVAALEGQGSRSPRVASPEAPRTGLRADSARDTVVGSDVPSPAPPAPLVESQIESIATEIGEAIYRLSHRGDDYKWPGCIAMREAIEPILRSRLARAKEAARG